MPTFPKQTLLAIATFAAILLVVHYGISSTKGLNPAALRPITKFPSGPAAFFPGMNRDASNCIAAKISIAANTHVSPPAIIPLAACRLCGGRRSRSRTAIRFPSRRQSGGAAI